MVIVTVTFLMTCTMVMRPSLQHKIGMRLGLKASFLLMPLALSTLAAFCTSFACVIDAVAAAVIRKQAGADVYQMQGLTVKTGPIVSRILSESRFSDIRLNW